MDNEQWTMGKWPYFFSLTPVTSATKTPKHKISPKFGAIWSLGALAAKNVMNKGLLSHIS
jgi:hypothetical protein